MKKILSLALISFVLVACSAAQKGGILDVKGDCGGHDGWETMCSWGGCCPGWMHCTPYGCDPNRTGPGPRSGFQSIP